MHGRIKMTNDQVPDFCLFVNTASKTSAIWTKADGWMECKPEEFEAILVVQQLVRNSDHPETTLMQIKNAMQEFKSDSEDE